MLLGKFARVVTGAAARAIIETTKTKKDAFMGNPAAAVEGADPPAAASASIPVSLSHGQGACCSATSVCTRSIRHPGRSGKCRLGPDGRPLVQSSDDSVGPGFMGLRNSIALSPIQTLTFRRS